MLLKGRPALRLITAAAAQAASSLRVPVELECTANHAAARTAPGRPFTLLLAAPDGEAQPFVTDAMAAKPDGCSRQCG